MTPQHVSHALGQGSRTFSLLSVQKILERVNRFGFVKISLKNRWKLSRIYTFFRMSIAFIIIFRLVTIGR